MVFNLPGRTIVSYDRCVSLVHAKSVSLLCLMLSKRVGSLSRQNAPIRAVEAGLSH